MYREIVVCNNNEIFFQIFELDGPLLLMIQNIFRIINVLKILRWFFLLVGAIFIGLGFYAYHHNRKQFQVAQINNTSGNDKTRQRTSTAPSGQNQSIQRRNHVIPVMTGHEFDKYKI